MPTTALRNKPQKENHPMKKVIELTIPIVVAITWSVLAVTTLHEVGALAEAVIGPSPDQFGPAIEINGETPVSQVHALQVPGRDVKASVLAVKG